MSVVDLDEFARDYLSLGLRINKHINGYVEYYYGPPEIKKFVDSEKIRSPKRLLNECNHLKVRLFEMDFEIKRENFLNKTLNAISTTLRELNGDKIAFLDKVKSYFDFEPRYYQDEFFYNLISKANDLYKGEGTIYERMKTYAKTRYIHPKLVKKLCKTALNIAKKKMLKVFPNLLPKNEKVKLKLVKSKSWSMYNWYLGKNKSRMEINLSSTYYWTNLLHLICHETYPGHHTEAVVRDINLYKKKGYFETSILYIYSPEMIIHEGIGELAEFVLFRPLEIAEIFIQNLCPNPEKEDDLDRIIAQNQLKRELSRIESNLAYHKYVNQWSDDNIINYVKKFEFFTKVGINEMLKFVSDKNWAPYVFAYQGDSVITEKYGNPPSKENFRKILSEQTIPSDLIN